MDTKSKKYKIIRIVSFLLCLVCICTSGLAVFRAADFGLQAGYFYGTDNFRQNMHDVRRSTSFLYEVGLSYYALRRAFVTYSDGAIFESGAFEKQLGQKADEYVEQYVKEHTKTYQQYADEYNGWLLKLDNPDNGYYGDSYWLECYGTLSPDDESPFDEHSSYVLNEDGTVGVNVAQLRREAKAHLGNEYNLTVYKNEYKYLKSYISTLGALQYFLVDNTTGQIYTNSGFATAEEFQQAYGENTWFVSSADNFDTVTVGPEFKKINDTSQAIARDYDYADETDLLQTKDGIILNHTSYTYEFLTSIRYGYWHSPNEYIVGSTSLFEAGPCTVYLSYDFSYVTDDADPFMSIESDYQDSVRNLERDVIIGLVSLALLVLLTLVILVLAGKKPVHLNRQNKIPGDLHLIVSIGAAIGMGALTVICGLYGMEHRYEVGEHYVNMLCFAGSIASAVVCYSFLINGLVTFIQNIAGRVFLKRLLTLLPIRLIKRLVKRLTANRTHLKNGVRRRFMIAVPIYALVLAIGWFIMAINTYEEGLCIFIGFVILLISAAFFVLLYYYAKSLDKIRETVAKTQQGDFDVQFDCNSMPKAMVDFAADISEMRSGMKLAVDSAVREQKAKAELITNVSHDLKTPLTSIVTYADLIARSTEGNEEVKEYSEVLTEKSMRLKHLIEDLTEATRVSTGAVELHPTRVNLCELAAQAVGENTDAFEKCGVEPIIKNNGETPVVFADGQKTYRVLENIISNITKYSMPGTRAYVAVGEENGMGTVVFRNISAAPLDISADELMERFVRGDSARTGEGSGLGLSIARDLCVLQNGKFEISIDGDMFTSKVYLPKA